MLLENSYAGQELFLRALPEHCKVCVLFVVQLLDEFFKLLLRGVD